MNKRQERFCEEYLIDLNQTQAAIRAGYSARSAGQIASELLKKPNVRARVDEMLAERSRRTGVTQDRVVRELARIGFVKLTDVIDVENVQVKQDADEDDLAALQGVKVRKMRGEMMDSEEREFRLADKTKALELLGRHLGMFSDRAEVMVNDRVVIVDDLSGDGSGGG